MKKLSIAILSLFLLGACTSVLTPRLDERTETTLKQRCVDYISTLESLKLLARDRDLSDEEIAVYNIASAFVSANCTNLPETQ